jgi:hypothetical protein
VQESSTLRRILGEVEDGGAVDGDFRLFWAHVSNGLGPLKTCPHNWPTYRFA